MSRVGLDWYKREPIAYLGDVQGLTTKEHAVYSVVLELLYIHGGSIRNDPKFISGWIADMGGASVRKVLISLDANPRITLVITDNEISQKRAKNEAKTKQKLRETARKSGSKGGEKSAESRCEFNKNNSLAIATAKNGKQPEKRREEKRRKNKNPPPPQNGGMKDFELFWKEYPDSANNIKIKAAQVFSDISQSDQKLAVTGAGFYRISLIEKPTSKIKRADRWLLDRQWEAFSQAEKIETISVDRFYEEQLFTECEKVLGKLAPSSIQKWFFPKHVVANSKRNIEE